MGHDITSQAISKSQSFSLPSANPLQAKDTALNTAAKPAEIHLSLVTPSLQQKSIMPDASSNKPELNSPNASAGKNSFAAVGQQIMIILHNHRKGTNIDDINQVVAGLAQCFNLLYMPQMSSKVNNNSGHEATTSPATNTVASSSSSSGKASSHPPVARGTDITAVNASVPQYCNLIGDTKTIDIFTSIINELNKRESQCNILSAKWSGIIIKCASLAGDKAIDAAKEHMSGAITSGGFSLVLQGGSTVRSVNALRNEAKSITNNLDKAVIKDLDLAQSKQNIKIASSTTLQRGESPNVGMENIFSSDHPKKAHESALLRNAHHKVTNKTSEIRSISDFTTQVDHLIHPITEAAFGVQAAEQTKEAELAKGSQTVANAVSDTHQQAAKRTGETEKSIFEQLSSMFGNVIDACSSIIRYIA